MISFVNPELFSFYFFSFLFRTFKVPTFSSRSLLAFVNNVKMSAPIKRNGSPINQ